MPSYLHEKSARVSRASSRGMRGQWVMVQLLSFFAVIGLLGGIAVFLRAKSAIHGILGTLAVGFSLLTAGMASILAEVRGGSTKITDHLAVMRQYYEPKR